MTHKYKGFSLLMRVMLGPWGLILFCNNPTESGIALFIDQFQLKQDLAINTVQCH